MLVYCPYLAPYGRGAGADMSREAMMAVGKAWRELERPDSYQLRQQH